MIVVVTEVVALTTRDARSAVARVAQDHDKPVVACFLGATTARVFGRVGVPGG